MEKIRIGDNDYKLAVDYSVLDDVRKSFNELTRATYGFDFEKWYMDGYWGDKYIPYSILDGDKVVSNISVNPIDFLINGEKVRCVQIGTVMTDEAYRNKGLNKRLMDRVLRDFERVSDIIYLFANDEVLEFYPKFDFHRAKEYVYSMSVNNGGNASGENSYRKLNISTIKDRMIMEKSVLNSKCFSKLNMVENLSLVMFYATYFMRDMLYYIEELDSVVVMEKDDGVLNLLDVFSSKSGLNDIVESILDDTVKEVVFGFTPIDTEGLVCRELNEDDTTLFIHKGLGNFLEDEKLMFPQLSHT